MIIQRQTYRVTGKHVAPDYDGKVYAMTLHEESDGTWFATADGLGCSKSYSTPCRAMIETMHDHGYTSIRVLEG